jgi:hypothetical protein
MFYSYTNVNHRYTAGFYNKISLQRSLLKPSTAYCILQYGTKKKQYDGTLLQNEGAICDHVLGFTLSGHVEKEGSRYVSKRTSTEVI